MGCKRPGPWSTQKSESERRWGGLGFFCPGLVPTPTRTVMALRGDASPQRVPNDVSRQVVPSCVDTRMSKSDAGGGGAGRHCCATSHALCSTCTEYLSVSLGIPYCTCPGLYQDSLTSTSGKLCLAAWLRRLPMCHESSGVGSRYVQDGVARPREKKNKERD